MSIPRSVCLFPLAVAACAGYAPAPVDLAAHAREFAARLPDADAVRAFTASLRGGTPTADGELDLATAHEVALWFNADLRSSRLRAGVAAVSAETAGRLADPELGVDLARILADVPDRWVTGTSLAFTLPLSGRLGGERAVADAEHQEALLAARIAELQVLDALDLAWAHWSALRLHADAVRAHLQQVEALEQIAQRLAAAQEITQLAARAFALERVARRAELLRLEADVVAAAQQRNELLGLPPDRDLPWQPTLRIDSRAPADALARTAALADGPRVRPALRAHDVAERKLELAVAAQWPELRLAPGFGNEDGDDRALLGLSLPLPLWNGNARAIATARAERDLAAATLCSALERATAELARAELHVDRAHAVRGVVDGELVPLAEQQIADSQRLLARGQLDTLLLLDALTRITAAKTAAVDAAVAEAEATVARNALFWPAAATPPAGMEDPR